MIVCRQKMLFILSLAQPQTTCRRSLLAWTVIYMKRSLRQGQKVVFWTLSPPGNAIYRYVYLYVGHDDLHLYHVCCVWM